MPRPPKVCFAIESPFSDRDFERFGIQEMLRDCDVSILSTIRVSKLPYDEVRTDSNGDAIRFTAPQTYRDLWKWIRIERPNFYVDLVGSSPAAVTMRLALRAASCARIVCAQGDVPHAMTWVNPNSLRGMPGRKLVGLLTPRAVLAVVGGQVALQRNEVVEATSRLLSQSLDANLFAQIRRSVSPYNSSHERYAVFVDEGMTEHPDLLHHRLSPPLEASAYYPPLAGFFDRVEEILEMPVKIAAHPSSTNPNRLSQFEHRAVSIGRTAQMIAGSELVFVHASTARSYAVLADKPLVFLTSKALEESWIGPSIRLGSDILNCPLAFFDETPTPAEARSWLQSRDSEAYRDYLRSYLVASDELALDSSWRAVAEWICRDTATSSRRTRTQTAKPPV